MRPNPETISALGRAPARTTLPGPPPSPPPTGLPPGRGALRRWLRSALFDNLALKSLSMVLAVTVFLLVNTDKDREMVVRVGVSYTLPDDKVLISERIEDVRVTVKGSWQRLRRFDPKAADRINLDLRHVASGDVAITPEMVRIPSGLKIGQIDPPTIRVAFDRRVEKVVEVSAAVTGRPQHGYVVSDVKPTPATIRVRGAQTILATVVAIYTREVSVVGRAESFVAETEMVMPTGIETESGSSVAVRVIVDEQLVSQKISGLAVKVVGEGADSGRWNAMPPNVEVTLTGALLAVEKAKAGVVALAKLSPGDSRQRTIAVTIEGLPPGIGVKASPEQVKVLPAKAPGSSTPSSE